MQTDTPESDPDSNPGSGSPARHGRAGLYPADLLAPALDAQRAATGSGGFSGGTAMRPGLSLGSDPALQATGNWRSPAGRLLELEIATTGSGGWIALHVGLQIPNLTGIGFIGLACHSTAPAELLIRPCLRSGTGDGFSDCFFDRHILAGPEPATHSDALQPGKSPDLPDIADWRELVLFLPAHGLRWDLHDLRLFMI